MKIIYRLLIAAFGAAFFMASASAQNAGTVTNHAFALGKGPGTTGYTSLLCGSAQLAVGQSAADPICRTISGDATLSAAGALTLGTVNSNVGSFGSATQCTAFTVNAKGLITAASATTCTPAVGSVTGLGTGVATALGVNVGTAGAFVVNGGALGTPSSGTLTNATGLPIASGVSGLGTGVATFLGTPSSANLRAALTDETGTGLAYFQGGALGTPASGTLTNATGLPIDGGTVNTLPVTRGGTGQTTFATNCTLSASGAAALSCTAGSVGNAGLPWVSNGAGSPPNYGTIGLGAISGLGTGIATWLGTPSSANLRAALTDETGTGAAYFQGGDIGTPSAGVGSNLTALNATQLTSGTLPAARTNGHMNGTATNDNAASGEVGEYSTATQSVGQSLTTNTPLVITSVSLTAGDWDVSCTAIFNMTSAGVVNTVVVGTNTTSSLGGIGTLNSFNFGSTGITPAGNFTMSSTTTRYSLASTTSVNCLMQSGFASTATGTGTIRARRIR